MSSPPSAGSRRLGDALVATADHVHRLHLGGNLEREKLKWLASIVAATNPQVAREIILRWGPSEDVA